MKTARQLLLRLLPMLLLLTAAGCSQHDLEPTPAPPQAEATTAYITLRIAIPHIASEGSGATRATESHGTQNEYHVQSALVVLYKGKEADPENDMAYVKTIDLEETTDITEYVKNEGYDFSKLFSADPSEHITTSGYITLAISATELDLGENQLYPLILLNWKGVITKDEIAGASTFGNFKDKTITKLVDSDGNLFMSNVAMATAPGSTFAPESSKIVTIPPVKAIFTEPDAKAEQGKTVFVERVAAKVGVSIATFDTDIIIDNNDYNLAKIHAMEWVVDNYNTESYTLRHFDFNDTWLGTYNTYAIDETEVKANYGDKTDSYRTLWGEDVNYNGSTGLTTYTDATEAFTVTNIHTNGEVQAIHENTQADNQRANMTRVVIRLLLKDASKVLLKGDNIYGIGPKDGTVKNICTSQYQLRKYLKKNKASLDLGLTDTEIDALTFTVTGSTVTTGNDKVTDKVTIYHYNDFDSSANKHPYVYYEAFIQHFGDAAPAGGLGKYGVVRNNAYTITIGTPKTDTDPAKPLARLGTPAYPAIGTGSID